jgi:hypothetical protein
MKPMETMDMRTTRVAPAEPGIPAFDSYIGNGEQSINWAVLMDGRLVVLPRELHVPGDGPYPTTHGWLTGDVPYSDDWVQTAGEAWIKKTDGGYQGIVISNKSGHYHPTPLSMASDGLPAFAEYGIIFPKKDIRFQYGPPPPGW